MLFLVFEQNGQRFALDTASVVEVLPLVEWQRLPGVPASVLGAINYHGDIIPLMHFGARAFAAPADANPASRIAVVRYESHDGERLIGVMLDHATALIRRQPEDFSHPAIASDAQYALGVAVDDAGMIQQVGVSELMPQEAWDALSNHSAAGRA